MRGCLFRTCITASVVIAGVILSGCGWSTTHTPATAGPSASGIITAEALDDPNLMAAVSTYRAYLNGQTAQLVATTQAFRDAIAAGDLEAARTAYVAARPFFERIASAAAYLPVAHDIDSQALHGPVDPRTGFHRIEFGLWMTNATSDLLPAADRLAADAGTLRDQIPTLHMDAIRMTEAYELLDQHPINTRFEEEPYSHTDLVDHQAHVDGSRVVFDALRPAIATRIPRLATTIEGSFADVTAALAPFHDGETFVAYTSLTQADRRRLSQAFDALSEILSRVKTVLQQRAR